MKKYLLMFAFVFFIMPVLAYSTYKQDQSIIISHPVRVGGLPSSSVQCNITVINPNNEELISFQPMNNNNYNYNYTLDPNQTDILGVYNYDLTCTDGNYNETRSFSFEVTPNGRERPNEFVIVSFVIIFLFLSFYFLYFIIDTFSFFMQKDLNEDQKAIFGLPKLIYNFAGYLSLWVYFYLSIYYLGNPLITRLTGIGLIITSWTNMFMPLVAFIVSVTLAGWTGILNQIRRNNYE